MAHQPPRGGTSQGPDLQRPPAPRELPPVADRLLCELQSGGAYAPDLLRRLVAEGKLGKKSGEGFYRWVDGNPVAK